MFYRINTIVNGKTYYVKFAKNSDFIWVCNKFDNATKFLDEWECKHQISLLDKDRDYCIWETNQEKIRLGDLRLESSFW